MRIPAENIGGVFRSQLRLSRANVDDRACTDRHGSTSSSGHSSSNCRHHRRQGRQRVIADAQSPSPRTEEQNRLVMLHTQIREWGLLRHQDAIDVDVVPVTPKVGRTTKCVVIVRINRRAGRPIEYQAEGRELIAAYEWVLDTFRNDLHRWWN